MVELGCKSLFLLLAESLVLKEEASVVACFLADSRLGGKLNNKSEKCLKKGFWLFWLVC